MDKIYMMSILLLIIKTSTAFGDRDFLVDNDIAYRPRKKPPPPVPNWDEIFGPINDPSLDPVEQTYENPELDSSELYGIENVRTKRRHNYQEQMFLSLCPSRRQTVYLNVNEDYEYRPDHYDEVRCTHPHRLELGTWPRTRPIQFQKNKPICSEAGFSCIQLNRTIFLTRRSAGTECWEVETRVVQAGCECMWPKHHFGEIAGN